MCWGQSQKVARGAPVFAVLIFNAKQENVKMIKRLLLIKIPFFHQHCVSLPSSTWGVFIIDRRLHCSKPERTDGLVC